MEVNKSRMDEEIARVLKQDNEQEEKLYKEKEDNE